MLYRISLVSYFVWYLVAFDGPHTAAREEAKQALQSDWQEAPRMFCVMSSPLCFVVYFVSYLKMIATEAKEAKSIGQKCPPQNCRFSPL